METRVATAALLSMITTASLAAFYVAQGPALPLAEAFWTDASASFAAAVLALWQSRLAKFVEPTSPNGDGKGIGLD